MPTAPKWLKNVNFKFGTHDPRQSPDMNPDKLQTVARVGGRVKPVCGLAR